MISYKLSNEIKKKLKEEEEKDTYSDTKSTDNKQPEKENNNKNISSVAAENDNTKADKDVQDNQFKDKDMKDVIEDLKSIKSKYQSYDQIDAPQSLGLEKVDVKEVSDEELNKLAKNSLDEKYNTKDKTIKSSFEDKVNSILENNEYLKDQSSQSNDKINKYYDESIKETENQALKRGLARSSIIISEISNLEGSRASELSNVLNNLQKNLNENENKINKLSQEKDEALNNLDIEYAIELSEKIDKLASEYAKQKEDAIKFNNNVAKLEAEYKLDLDKQKLDKKKQNLALQEKYGDDIYKSEIESNQYDYLKNYFDSLEPKYALSLFLTNKELKSILGDNYTKMYKYLSSRV